MSIPKFQEGFFIVAEREEERGERGNNERPVCIACYVLLCCLLLFRTHTHAVVDSVQCCVGEEKKERVKVKGKGKEKCRLVTVGCKLPCLHCSDLNCQSGEAS